MTLSQVRFNTDKPKLTYFWCNLTAAERMREHFPEMEWGEEDFPLRENWAHAIGLINEFLATGPGASYGPLVTAMNQVTAALEEAVTPDPTPDLDYDTENYIAFYCSAPHALAAYCSVCVYGEGKYSRGNYRLGAPITTYLDSALRHLGALVDGQDFDPESKEHHGALAMWNLWQALDQPADRDDRMLAVYAPALLNMAEVLAKQGLTCGMPGCTLCAKFYAAVGEALPNA